MLLRGVRRLVIEPVIEGWESPELVRSRFGLVAAPTPLLELEQSVVRVFKLLDKFGRIAACQPRLDFDDGKQILNRDSRADDFRAATPVVNHIGWYLAPRCGPGKHGLYHKTYYTSRAAAGVEGLGGQPQPTLPPLPTDDQAQIA